MTEVLVFGADSLVGSHFVRSTRSEVTAAGRNDPRTIGLSVARFVPCDLLKPKQVEEVVRNSTAPAVVNFAAATNVDAVERGRPPAPPGPRTEDAFVVNALAPEAMARATRSGGKRLVSLSTDFVFDGRGGPYSESAIPDEFSERLSWYGWTKGEGERRLRAVDAQATVVRITYPYGHPHPRKRGFSDRLLDAYRNRTLPPMFIDQQITPTWIPDVSRAIDYLLPRPFPGVVHVASPEVTTPYAFAEVLLLRAESPPLRLTRGSMHDYLAVKGTTPRPIRGGLLSTRLPSVGISMTSWREGIRQLELPSEVLP